jgi:hypothetical protein
MMTAIIIMAAGYTFLALLALLIATFLFLFD